MRNINQHRTKKGQTLLEIIAVLVIIGAILAAVIPTVTTSTDKGRVMSAMNAVRSIQSAAVGYYNDNGGTYTGIAVGTPSSPGLVPKYLPSSFTGTGANPWGGNITVAVNGTTTNQFVLTMTSVPYAAQQALQTALQNISIATSTPSQTTTTFTATFS